MLDEEYCNEEYDLSDVSPQFVSYGEEQEMAMSDDEALTTPMGATDNELMPSLATAASGGVHAAAGALPVSKLAGLTSPPHGVQDGDPDIRRTKAGAGKAEGAPNPAGRPSRARARPGEDGASVRRAAGSAPPCFRTERPNAGAVTPRPGPHEQQRLQGGAKMEDKLAAAAGIKEAGLSQTRSSPRLAAAIDQHSLEKAKKRAAWKNLDTEEFKRAICQPCISRVQDATWLLCTRRLSIFR
nr:unnamed protein product [Digitaria exilis]